MTLLIVPERGLFGWFATWELAGQFGELLADTSEDRAARDADA